MNVKTKICVIINPVSGIGKHKTVEKELQKHLDFSKFNLEIKYTQAPKHATELAKEAVNNKFDIIIAVGGDGSVNEVSRELINTNTALAIIPAGSGNGFARFFKIPLTTRKAIQTINKLNITTVDTATINDEPFVNIAGIGFEAKIGHMFSTYGKRGFSPYFKLVIKEYFRYKPLTYDINIDGKQINTKALLVCFANTSQWGYNFNIAPNARISDGYLDLCIMKKPPLYALPFTLFKLCFRSIHKSRYVDYYLFREGHITQHNAEIAHFDGEPLLTGKEVFVNIVPSSLRVVVS